METYLIALKDILVILSPIVVAWISYRGMKKSQKDIRLEVERITKEKEAETNQLLQKIGAELESQKQLLSWQNSIPQTNEYMGEVGAMRCGTVCSLSDLTMKTHALLDSQKYTQAELGELQSMLERIELPSDEDPLYPHEIPYLMQYMSLLRRIEILITQTNEVTQ